MSARPVPETFNRQDWPRLVAARTKDHEDRISAVERVSIRTITASASVADSDVVLLVDATAGAVTVTLPAAASSSGRVLYVKKTDASGNAVTLDGNASETIDGATTLAIATQYQSYTVICDGTGWWII